MSGWLSEIIKEMPFSLVNEMSPEKGSLSDWDLSDHAIHIKIQPHSKGKRDLTVRRSLTAKCDRGRIPQRMWP